MLSTSMVVPSGFAAITSATAGTVLPPGLLMTLTGTPQRVSSTWAMTRAHESVDAPATNGTISSTGLVGYLAWACAPAALLAASARLRSAVITARSMSSFLRIVGSRSFWLRCSALARAVAYQSGYRARAPEPKRHSQDQ